MGRTTLSGHEPTRRSIHRLAFMFRCQLCQCVVPPRTPAQHLALKRRRKEYRPRSAATTFVRTTAEGKRKEYHADDPGGEGEEMVEEGIVFPACAARNGHG